MILDLNYIGQEEESKTISKERSTSLDKNNPLPYNTSNNVVKRVVDSTSESTTQFNYQQQVIKRVYHTRQEFSIYPGGKIFPGKIQGWFEDKVYSHKPKEKKKAEVTKKVTMKKEEVY